MKLNRSREWSCNNVAKDEVYFFSTDDEGSIVKKSPELPGMASGRESIIIGVFAEGPGEGLFAKSPSPDRLPNKEVSSCSVLRI